MSQVNFSTPRGFVTSFKSDCKETFFPDDPFRRLKHQRWRGVISYFIPIFQWLPQYNLNLLRYDFLAGITITALAIPQGISYAKLAQIPPIIGLYSSFVPPFVYAVFGTSKHLAVGTVAASSLILAATIGEVASPKDNPTLYLHLIFTATFITGLFDLALGISRLGFLVDFLSHSTITGFMGGTATIICLQQLKGFLGLKDFTSKTDVVSVLQAVFSNRKEWKWESAVVGIIFLIFLQFTRYLSQRNPKKFWISAVSPMVVVTVGCLFAYFAHAEKYGIQTVGKLTRGLNPPSIQYLNFDSRYLPTIVKAALITGLISLAEGIAIGRSFAIMRNEQIDGNKEMIAFGLMNIIGSFTSCYLTTGPFSKTAVNFNAGCRTAMANVVMGLGMMVTLLVLAPVFSYTPLVALSTIIMSAMLGLIKYDQAYHLFKVDKFDFFICVTAFFTVSFISMDVGLIFAVGLSVLRALLYIARPASCKLGRIPGTNLYRDVEQYPATTTVPGVVLLQIGSPIYFANCTYIKERVVRYIQEEDEDAEDVNRIKDPVEHLLLDLSAVTSIDATGIETIIELIRILEGKGVRLAIINPRMEVMEKLLLSEVVDVKLGREVFFLSIEEALNACQFGRLRTVKKTEEDDPERQT